MYEAVYARKEGLGNSYIGKISFPVFMTITAIGTVIIGGILAFSGSPWLIFVPFICLLFAFGFRRYIEAKLGGLTRRYFRRRLGIDRNCFSCADEYFRYIFTYLIRHVTGKNFTTISL